VLEMLWEDRWYAAILFFGFIILAGITVMNMLVGVLVEVVSVVASTEKEALTLGFVKSKLDAILTMTGVDHDGNGCISKVEFLQIMDNHTATTALREVGVDVVGLIDFVDFIFDADDDGSQELTSAEFMELVVQFRGTNMATVKDIVDLRKFMRTQLEKMQRKTAAMNPSDQIVGSKSLNAWADDFDRKFNMEAEVKSVQSRLGDLEELMRAMMRRLPPEPQLQAPESNLAAPRPPAEEVADIRRLLAESLSREHSLRSRLDAIEDAPSVQTRVPTEGTLGERKLKESRDLPPHVCGRMMCDQKGPRSSS